MMLKTGDMAPAIELPDSDMKQRSLAGFAGSWVVVYFYPKDDTPGCTIQANEFTDLVEEYAEAVLPQRKGRSGPHHRIGVLQSGHQSVDQGLRFP